MARSTHEAKARILDAARKVFGRRGYSAAATQDICELAGVTKPTLYYYFESKAGLYQALVDFAADERYEIMRKSVQVERSLEDRLTALLDDLLKHARKKRDLLRIVFASWFAAPGELPKGMNMERGLRNFEFMHSVIKDGLKSGELDTRYGSWEIASGFVAQLFLHSMAQILQQRKGYRPVAPRTIVRLFLNGAAKHGGRR